MLLHRGASLHSCDYPQAERRPSPSPHRPRQSHPLVRSALRSRSQGHSPPHSFASAASTAQSEDSEQTLHDHNQASALEPNSDNHQHHHHFPHPHLPTRSHSDAAPRKGLAVRFLDLMDYAHSAMTPETASEDESVAPSDLSGRTETSDTTQKRRRRRSRQPRVSTTYALAHPAPLMRTKQRSLFQFRPRVMLQLQALGEKRATPAFDVVPSVLVAGSIMFPKLARHCPRLIKSKCELGPDDLLIVRSEDYSTVPETRKREDDSIKDRELLGLICPRTQDSVDIVLHGDNIWTTSKMPDGSFEFTHTNVLGTVETARWVRRAAKPIARTSWGSTGSGDTTPTATRPDPDHRWTFSIIDPNTKRHPILGVIQDERLEVYESYPTVSASSGRHPPIKPFPEFISGGEDISPLPSPGLAPHETRETLQVTDAQKELMIATATWISLRQAGWPQSANPRLANVRAHHNRSSSASSAEKCARAPPASLKRRSTNTSNLQNKAPWSVADSRLEDVPRHSRTTSIGHGFARPRNQEQSEAPSEVVPDCGDEKAAAEDDSESEREATPTCGGKVHRLASRLFRGKKGKKDKRTSKR